MADFQLKRGDTSPPITETLTDRDGEPVVLTTAFVDFHMAATPAADDPTVDANAEILDAESGRVAYEWTAADTDTAGLYYAEFEVEHDNGAVETYPHDGYLTVYIVPDVA